MVLVIQIPLLIENVIKDDYLDVMEIIGNKPNSTWKWLSSILNNATSRQVAKTLL
jgi:hypothetical protein